jgi:sporulation protein YlmC with PRC-barrel domain
MRVDLDAKVRTRDGDEAGSVQAAVIDPHTNEVTDFVVSTGGWLGKDVLVPREEIDRASEDGDAIRLDLTKAELEALPAYVSDSYMPPPAGWALPAGYAFGTGAGGFLWPAGYFPPMSYSGATSPAPAPAGAGVPAGQQAAVGVESADEVSVDKGALVLDAAGHDIGVVDDVRFDAQTGRLSGLVIRVGSAFRTLFGGGDTVEIGAEGLSRVGDGVVHLRVTKQELTP